MSAPGVRQLKVCDASRRQINAPQTSRLTDVAAAPPGPGLSAPTASTPHFPPPAAPS